MSCCEMASYTPDRDDPTDPPPCGKPAAFVVAGGRHDGSEAYACTSCASSFDADALEALAVTP